MRSILLITTIIVCALFVMVLDTYLEKKPVKKERKVIYKRMMTT